MKQFAAAVMIALACVPVMGQVGASNTVYPPSKPVPVLQCPKYQHQQHTAAHCANTCLPDATFCTSQCTFVPDDDRCVDDTHTVTEREWQDLMARLKALEKPTK